MISLGLLFAVAAGGGVLAAQSPEADPVAGLACAAAGVVGHGAGAPTTELMAMGERPFGCLRDFAR
ncbi:MAG TPA: hypothetical protein VJP04_05090 [Terriglobales bacterium]|nr:hypothetical protein [Terriglobales bacterium]